MKKKTLRHFVRVFEIAALATLLTACATPSEKKEEQSGGAVHALNYSAREVAYIAVEHPGHPEGGGGGDALNPYGGGGDICCFSVPAKWSPDIRVVIVYQLYPEKTYRRVEVGVPPYPNGKAGDIWLIVHPDESAEAVVSDFGPSRPEWPGKIKGYPVPSREYRLKLWEKSIKQAQDDVTFYKKLLNDFSTDDVEKTWAYRSNQKDKRLAKYKGVDDPAFAEYLKNEYQTGLKFYSNRLEYILKNKP